MEEIIFCNKAILKKADTKDYKKLILAVEDGDLYNLWYTTVPSPKDMKQEIERRLSLYKKNLMMPYHIFIDDEIVGMTSIMNIDNSNKRCEIGSTWYKKSFQGTSLNKDIKLGLLAYIFEELKYIAVEFRTHILNIQSRRAIESIGAKLDGILRNHKILENKTIRDTCVYSIIQNEWLAIKEHLTHKLKNYK